MLAGPEFPGHATGLACAQVKVSTPSAQTVADYWSLGIPATSTLLGFNVGRSRLRAAPPDPGMIPLTIPEIARLLAGRTLRLHPKGHATHWLDWRRRHQARSRWFHRRARLATSAETTLVS